MGAYDKVSQQIPDVLRWHPKWVWDPVPWWFFETVKLSPDITTQLALVQMEFEHSILENQIRASKKAMELLNKIK